MNASSAGERRFPGTPEMVEAARGFVREGLAAAPAVPRDVADDALLCLSELAGNAVRHSHSGTPGGEFSVRYEITRGYVRVEVVDAGGPWGQPFGRQTDTEDEHGRGLHIVQMLGSLYAEDDPDGPGHRVGVLVPYTAAAVAAAPSDRFEVTP
jgi:anti-sigma regulatory factor (Ser/Thr protein kinase)